jgi:hypothetical protein
LWVIESPKRAAADIPDWEDRTRAHPSVRCVKVCYATLAGPDYWLKHTIGRPKAPDSLGIKTEIGRPGAVAETALHRAAHRVGMQTSELSKLGNTFCDWDNSR